MILKVTNVEKTYGGPFNLGPINLEINEGETVALLGKNGAGKSTFFQIITGSMDATSGEVTFLGSKLTPDAFTLKRKLGYLPQNLQLPRWVSGVEILRYGVSLYELPEREKRVNLALKYWDCDWFANRPLAACSHGMQKRIALALATIHEPDLLILDEPFSGLDIYHIRALENIIESRVTQGKATILCTHIAPYAAKICHRALLFESGKMEWLKNWYESDQLTRIGQVESHFFRGLNI